MAFLSSTAPLYFLFPPNLLLSLSINYTLSSTEVGYCLLILIPMQWALMRDRYVGHKNIPIMQWRGAEQGRSALRHRVALTPLRIHVLVCMAILHHQTWLSEWEREQASVTDHWKATLPFIKKMQSEQYSWEVIGRNGSLREAWIWFMPQCSTFKSASLFWFKTMRKVFKKKYIYYI